MKVELNGLQNMEDAECDFEAWPFRHEIQAYQLPLPI